MNTESYRKSCLRIRQQNDTIVDEECKAAATNNPFVFRSEFLEGIQKSSKFGKINQCLAG